MDEQVGGRAVLESLRENLPQLRDAIRELPGVIRHLSEQASRGKLQMNIESTDLSALRRALSEQQRQRFYLGAGGTASICGVLLLGLGSAPAFGWILLAAGILSILIARPTSPR
jgi:hypothetical protein